MNKTLARSKSTVIMLAGTFFIMLPAHAGNGGGVMRQMQLANPGASNRDIRQMIRNDASSSHSRGHAAGRLPQRNYLVQPSLPQVNTTLSTSRHNHINNRLNKLSDHSAFIKDNGRANALMNGLELDLTSSDRVVVLGQNLFLDSETHVIKTGGEERTLSKGAHVTAAEYVALKQVLNDGLQSLVLDQNGRGIGGQFNLNNISEGGKTVRAAELVIPEHVTASGDFSKHADGVRVTNDLVNHGFINAFSSEKQLDTAKIGARDITNSTGAIISTSTEKLNLSLRADRDLNNAGTISSSGNLEIYAGHSITNSGSVTSGGSITLSGNPDTDLLVNNIGGTFSATNGAINIRSSDYVGTGNTTIYGGDFLSREMNLFTGLGTTDVVVEQLTGVVNSSGTAAHVSAKTDTLALGTQCLVGDPTYYNFGNIQLLGDIVVGESLAIIASGDITRGGTNTVIRAQTTNGQGHDINIIAGANVTMGADTTGSTLPGQPPVTGNAQGLVSFTGASATGGNVDLSGSGLSIDSSASGANFSGGNITIAAYANSLGVNGIVLIPTGVISTYGIGSGGNGGLSIVAGGVGGAIQVLSQTLAGAGSGPSGDVTFVTAQPTFSSGTMMTFDTTGAITTGNHIVPSGTINDSASILVGSELVAAPINTSGGNVFLHAGELVNVFSTIITDAPVAAGNAGNITIISDENNVTTAGLLRARGANTGTGGAITLECSSSNALTVIGAIADGGNGGSISIKNKSTGGVELVGLINADGFGAGALGNAGDISVSSLGAIITNAATISANGGSNATNGGSVSLRGVGIVVTGNTTLSAISPAVDNSISLTTDGNGLTTNGNDFSATTSGTLNLSINNNTISGSSATLSGGAIKLDANEIVNALANAPLVLVSNGADNGGKITYINHSTNPTFVGAPLKTPKGAFNLLDLSAHAGAFDGDGGEINVVVGGNLTVSSDSLDVSSSPSAGPHLGGTIHLSAGEQTSTKVGKLIILGNLNVDGTNGGGGGEIVLASAFAKTFTIGGTTTPKNGVQGTLSAVGGTISVDSGSGIQLLSGNAINSADVSLEANGKGKISAAKGVRLAGNALHLFSDSGSIVLNTNAARLEVFTDSSATINNDSGLLMIQFGGVVANGGVELHNSGNINYGSIRVGTKGDLVLVSETGSISSQSSGSLLATNGDVIVQAKDTTNGRINFAHAASVKTDGPKAGDITIAIGELPKKPQNSVPDQFSPNISEFVVTNSGKGKTFFGVNPAGVTSDGAPGPVVVITRDRQVIFNNASTNPGTNPIGFIGDNVVEAGPPN